MKRTRHARFGACLGLLMLSIGVLAVFAQKSDKREEHSERMKHESAVWKASVLAADAAQNDAVEAAHAESERILHDVVRPGIKDLRPGLGEAWTAESVQKVVELIRMRNDSLLQEKTAIQTSGKEEKYSERLASIDKHYDDNVQTIFRFQVVTAARAESDRVLREEVRPGIEALRPQDGERWKPENALAAADLVRSRNAALEDERSAIEQNGYADSHDDRLNRIDQILAENEDAIRRFEQLAEEAANKDAEESARENNGSNDTPSNTDYPTGSTPEPTAGSVEQPGETAVAPQQNQSLTDDQCGRVLHYHFESIDPRFGISEDQARQLFVEAEAVWEGQTGMNLFEEKAGSSLPVRFVYGRNQEDYNILDQMRVEIDSDRADYDSAVQLYRDLVAQYRNDSSNEDLVNRINALVDHIRRVGPLLEARIDRFNRIGRGSGPMTLGYYFRQGSKEGIDVLVLQRQAFKRVRLVAHELAHALGLDHVRDAEAVMYALNSGDDNVLRQDDRDELDKICRRRNAGRSVHDRTEREEVQEVW